MRLLKYMFMGLSIIGPINWGATHSDLFAVIASSAAGLILALLVSQHLDQLEEGR